MKKNLTPIVLALVALILGGYAVLRGPVQLTTETIREIGAQPGPEYTERQYFKSGYQNGCNRFATSSTAATFTLTTANEIKGDVCYLDWTPNVNTTLTTMASSSMPWLGNVAGDTREFWLRNASTTAASSITLAAGTGVDLQFTEATGGDLVLNGLDIGKLTFIRKSNTDVLVIWDEFTEAD